MWQGAVGVAPVDGLISPAYVVAKPFTGTESRFFAYMFRTKAYMDEVDKYSHGIVKDRNRLYWEDFKQMPSLVPPTEEQQRIADFLEAYGRIVARLIRAKRRLIELLNEQKQVIIHRAVTRGLDPSVRLKPSGIEWLGDVPEQWDVLRSKYIFREIDNRSSTGTETHLSMSQRLGLVPSVQIEERRLMSESYQSGKICERNDIVLNRLKAHLGVFALATERGVVSPDYTVLRAIRPVAPRYFEYVLRTSACRVELRKRAKGIVEGFWRLYTDDLYDISLPVPPLEEQDRTVASLDTDLSRVNDAIESAYREINLVREYRTRLIADVVTGRLDVRAVELPTLDEAESVEDLDASDEPEADDMQEDDPDTLLDEDEA
jgi:type I restriction enzyme S subunit